MVSDKFNIRKQNESMLLKKIIDEQNISRADLSKLTGLNKASVSTITKDLIENNFVFEIGTGNSSSVGGRKPVLLEFNPKVATVIAIDVGINYIYGIHSYLNGEEISWFEETDITISKENVLNLINKAIEVLTKKTDLEVVSLAIGVHGVVNNNDIYFTPYYDLTDLNLIEELTKLYDYPIFIENEANLVALGAYCFGLEAHSLVGLSIHSGIGAGIVNDGLLQKGQYGEAGEVGHTILFPGGEKCPCGNLGCFEQYASTEILFNKIKGILNLNYINSLLVKKEYYNNNKEVVKTLEENAYLLSIGINNISSFLNPQTIIINSPIYNIIPELIDQVKSNLSGQFSNKINIKPSALGKKSIVYGGVALASQNFLNINKLKFI
ncbi:ROK family protein [Ruoffia tabacinasalis]|uniref:ROK family protein n=1 Tax=Ruoffia tabacinasalis TaxID=87458 RepID=A0A5R9DV69_9LACT|nr:ROK family protein [Ruoffia tabacinasalis]TLQ39863.1 ROK family protein [Ruoffia tabacinasalis]